MDSLGSDSFQSAFVLTTGGRLRIGTLFSDLAAWDLTVLPNEAPVAAWTAPPARAGASLSTKFPWRVSQRWGVAALAAEIAPSGRPDLPGLTLKLPLPGTPRQAAGAATEDLAENPYAGVRMTARLVARDVSGQSGVSETVDFVLPARVFHHPLARAIADLRRRVALHPNETADAAADLAALAEAPFAPNDPSHLSPSAVVLNLAAAAAVLGAPHPDAAQLPQVQSRLWTLALALDGALPDANARALADAQERLRQGLEERAHGRLSDKELAKRLDALREALDKRLADIARQAMQKGAIQNFDPHTQHLSSSAMDRLIRKMEQAVREGRMQEAEQRLAELQKMLDQLKNAHIMSHEEMQAQQEQARRGRQMMGAVQDLVRRETTLLDHAQQRMPEQMPGLLPYRGFNLMPMPNALPNPPPWGAPPAAPDEGQDGPSASAPDQLQGDVAPNDGAPPPALAPPSGAPPQGAPQGAPQGPAETSQDADARTQRALHRALDAMSQSFVESGGKQPRALDDAGHAMGDAAGALAQHDDTLARDAIGRAIAALQQGGQDMARQMSSSSAGQMQLSLQPGGRMGENGSGQEGEDEPDDGQGGRKKDPFGRQVDGNGTIADDPSLRVPDDMEQGRSRAIQEELRRRGADRQRPQGELNYIDRLLKPF
jgi:ribosomal protein S20